MRIVAQMFCYTVAKILVTENDPVRRPKGKRFTGSVRQFLTEPTH